MNQLAWWMYECNEWWMLSNEEWKDERRMNEWMNEWMRWNEMKWDEEWFEFPAWGILSDFG